MLQQSQSQGSSFPIEHLAHKSELGSLRQVHMLPKQYTDVFGAAMLCLSITLMSSSILVTPQNALPPEIEIAALIVLAAALLWICLWVLSPHQYIYLWQHGFMSKRGRNLQVFRWNEITSIKSSPGDNFYTVRRQDGYQVRFMRHPELDALMAIVMQEVARQRPLAH